MADTVQLSRRWLLSLFVFSILLVVFVCAFFDTMSSMISIWWSDRTYGHGFVVVPMSAVLIWGRRRDVLSVEPEPQILGILLLGGAVFVWLLADVMGIQLFRHVAVILIVQFLVLAIFGWRIFRKIIFPLGFLFFAVPFGNFLIAPLQDLTAHLAAYFLRLSGVPVYLDGLFLHIPSGDFFVAEACSGIRFLISTIVLGSLLAYLLVGSWQRRLAIVGLSVIIPIVANGFRAYGIVLLAHVSNHEIAVGADHIVYGWVFFSFVTICLLIGAWFLRDRDVSTQNSVGRSRDVHRRTSHPNAAPTVIMGLVAALVMVAGPGYSALSERREPPAPVEGEVEIAVKEPWHVLAEPSRSWHPMFPGADHETLRAYAGEDGDVMVYAAFYGHQRDGAEVVNEMNRFSDEEGWKRVGGGSRTVMIDGQSHAVMVARLARGEGKRLVWYWYWVDGTFTGSPLVAKLLQARARLPGGMPSAAVMAVAADYEESPDEAVMLLEKFIRDVDSFSTPLAGLSAAANSR